MYQVKLFISTNHGMMQSDINSWLDINKDKIKGVPILTYMTPPGYYFCSITYEVKT